MQTIDTAPKKGKLLLYVPGKGWVQGRFRDKIQIDVKKWTDECFIDDNLPALIDEKGCGTPLPEPKGE